MHVPTWLREHGDVVLAAVVAAEMLRELLAAGTLSERPVAVLLALLATLPLAFRRRQPLASFVILWSALITGRTLVPVLPEELAFLAVFFVSLYSLGSYARGTAAHVGAVLVAGGIVTFVLNDGDAFAPGDVLFATALVGGPWGAGVAIRLRREREEDLVASARELERQREQGAQAAVAEERARIARELHDVVSHALSVTILQARGGRRMLDVDRAAALGAFDVIEHANAQALGDMRRLLTVLRDVNDADDQLAPAPQPSLDQLEPLIEHLRASGVAVALHVDGDRAAVPPGIDLSAYRIVQESLTNVLKHARATQARVCVRCGADELEIVVDDDGVGAMAGTGVNWGHGMVGMRERVAVAGGDLQAGPRAEGGFRVVARLPYQVPS